MSEEAKTRMIFRKFPGGDVIALMPDVPERQYIGSYQHIGQHGIVHPDLIKELEFVTHEEYRDLFRELQSIGYNIEIIDGE